MKIHRLQVWLCVKNCEPEFSPWLASAACFCLALGLPADVYGPFDASDSPVKTQQWQQAADGEYFLPANVRDCIKTLISTMQFLSSPAPPAQEGVLRLVTGHGMLSGSLVLNGGQLRPDRHYPKAAFEIRDACFSGGHLVHLAKLGPHTQLFVGDASQCYAFRCELPEAEAGAVSPIVGDCLSLSLLKAMAICKGYITYPDHAPELRIVFHELYSALNYNVGGEGSPQLAEAGDRDELYATLLDLTTGLRNPEGLFDHGFWQLKWIPTDERVGRELSRLLLQQLLQFQVADVDRFPCKLKNPTDQDLEALDCILELYFTQCDWVAAAKVITERQLDLAQVSQFLQQKRQSIIAAASSGQLEDQK